jgi:hypothetical protein
MHPLKQNTYQGQDDPQHDVYNPVLPEI